MQLSCAIVMCVSRMCMCVSGLSSVSKVWSSACLVGVKFVNCASSVCQVCVNCLNCGSTVSIVCQLSQVSVKCVKSV